MGLTTTTVSTSIGTTTAPDAGAGVAAFADAPFSSTSMGVGAIGCGRDKHMNEQS